MPTGLAAFRQHNREILASVHLEPKEEPKPDAKKPPAAAAATGGPNHATEVIIRCMKKALAQSISNISMPEKERPLNPTTDFTFKTKTQFGPKVDAPSGLCTCSASVKNSPFEDSDEDSDDELVQEDEEDFTFTDHAPMCYRHIRSFFSVDPKQYQEVLCQSGWHSIPTPGKSTAQLFFCGQNWVVKTMTAEESKFLQTILHRYYYHVRDNPHTLLPHFVGHHSIYVKSLKEKVRFIIMQNVFATENKINEKFDLKGSTVNRFATREEKKKLTCTKKDLDINRPMRIGPKRRVLLVEQMRKDCEFLKKASIMDYSFLIGIHLVETPTGGGSAGKRGTMAAGAGGAGGQASGGAGGDIGAGVEYNDGRCFTADQGGMLSSDDPNHPREIYYVGIIDILQEYNWWKSSETVVQGVIHNRHQISSVPPKEYAARFYSFMSNLVV